MPRLGINNFYKINLVGKREMNKWLYKIIIYILSLHQKFYNYLVV